MKKYTTFFAILVAAVLLLAGCGAGTSNGDMVGAYSAERGLTEEDLAIFNEAMETETRTEQYIPLSVATQVVAGTNYRFLVAVTNGRTSREVYVYIFQPLDPDEKCEFIREEEIENENISSGE